MAIPQEKLKNWSVQGATVTAKSTHESVRRALNDSEELKKYNFEVYLQGSYKNSTNIYGNSDVDIVVQLNSIFSKDLSEIPLEEKNLFNSAYNDATYSLTKFKSSVIEALKDYFGSPAVSEGNKCIKINKNSNRLHADVVVCNQYRKYKQFLTIDSQTYVEGITFNTKYGRKISFPKIHFKNGSYKNSEDRTNGFYKPNVRIFKNARSYLIKNGIIYTDLAPSYFVECLLYNVPDKLFLRNNSDTYLNIVSWLRRSLLRDNYQFLCQDEQTHLFGDSSDQWDKDNALELIVKLIELWEDW